MKEITEILYLVPFFQYYSTVVETTVRRVSSHISLSFVVVNVTFHTKQTTTEKAMVNQPFINYKDIKTMDYSTE